MPSTQTPRTVTTRPGTTRPDTTRPEQRGRSASPSDDNDCDESDDDRQPSAPPTEIIQPSRRAQPASPSQARNCPCSPCLSQSPPIPPPNRLQNKGKLRPFFFSCRFSSTQRLSRFPILPTPNQKRKAASDSMSALLLGFAHFLQVLVFANSSQSFSKTLKHKLPSKVFLSPGLGWMFSG